MPDLAELPDPEIVDPNYPRGPFRCAVFDFDGTLSLIRGNWQGLMIPRMVEVLLATGTQEPRDVLVEIVSEFVTRLTGRPTMLQMEALADEVARRGQPRPDPQVHLDEYLERLIAQSQERIRAVQTAQTPADELLVPGSRPLVEHLAERNLLLVISSGTELDHVRHEAGILGLASHFAPRIYGPVNNDPSFSKQRVLEMLIAEHGLAGHEIVCIGDGPAEILAGRAVGALTIGVASDEVDRSGHIHPLKREHLLRSGVHAVIPDYRRLGDVLALLGMAPTAAE
ncbi:MAG: HAD family hydrolase [Pirellulaceae bacterium]|jgi:phosphoglycolate phosphatase-like HAD superfamily hydrolase|nr:HAD family hydrolase [Pirellulaceae bacterium]